MRLYNDETYDDRRKPPKIFVYLREEEYKKYQVNILENWKIGKLEGWKIGKYKDIRKISLLTQRRMGSLASFVLKPPLDGYR